MNVLNLSVFISGCLATAIVHCASFDCSKSKSTSEKLICGDALLSKLDDKLDTLYKREKASAPDPVAFSKYSLQRWKDRETSCNDKACLIDWYEQRKNELTKVQVANVEPRTAGKKNPTGSNAVRDENQTCSPENIVPYCQSSEALAKTFSYSVSLFNITSGGMTASNLAPLYAQGCSFAGPKLKGREIERHTFNLKNGSAHMVKIVFSAPLQHVEDTYASNGEYIGQTTVSHKSGWFLTRQLTCTSN
jgi:uncharacterized protein